MMDSQEEEACEKKLLRLPGNLSKAGCSRKLRNSEAAAHRMKSWLDESNET